MPRIVRLDDLDLHDLTIRVRRARSSTGAFVVTFTAPNGGTQTHQPAMNAREVMHVLRDFTADATIGEESVIDFLKGRSG